MKNMGIDSHRHFHLGMTGQLFHNVGSYSLVSQHRDEGVPLGVEMDNFAVFISLGNLGQLEIRIQHSEKT